MQDSLFQACQLIGAQLDLVFICPQAFHGTVEENLQNLCMNSRIYYRRVRLPGNWWKDPSIPFLAFYGEALEPVAIISLKEGGYQGINPATGARFSINSDQARLFSSFAYMFYRQLKNPRLTIPNIWTFIMSRRQSDWLTFLFLVLCSTLANLSLPVFTRSIFDDVIPDRNVFLLLEITLGAFLISFATLAFNFGREVIILRLETLTDHDLEMAIWQKLIQLPVRFFKRYCLYDLFTFTGAISSIRKLLISHTVEVIFNSFFGIIYFSLMFYYSWTLSLVALGILMVEMTAIIISVYFGVRYSRQLLDKQIQLNNQFLEMVLALTKVRLAGVESRMFNRWKQSFSHMTQIDLKVLFLQLKSEVFNVFWSHTSTWILYLFLVLMIFSEPTAPGSFGLLTLGELLAFISVFSLFSNSLTQLANTLVNIVDVAPFWEKTRTFAEAEPEEITFKPDPGVLLGEVRVDQLTFSYQPNSSPILKNISFLIRPGERVAFVGQSGCGKTTLLKLLLGFETYDQGVIHYDNKDLREFNLQAMRRQFGVVLQSGAIFDGTIQENVNAGRNYPLKQIQEVLYSIGAEAFIEELPMGMNTLLTNGGMAFSGGQRQMILLARAIIGKPKILILDEATSSLDNEKQKIIYKYLNHFSMTQIIVAHRLETIQHVDRIYMIDQGQIVDEGTFCDLMNKPGFSPVR